MKIKFMGAAGTVTGSSYVLTSGSGKSILIDLGMFQGTPDIEQLNYKQFEYDPKLLEGVVLTHAHLDHCGRLPILLSRGFRGKMYMTSPTYDLTELSLLDSAKIAEYDGKRALYDKSLVYKTVDRFRTIDYRTPFQVGDFKVTFRDAGHIIGSTSLEIEDLSPSSEIKKIVFSGDLGNSPEDLVLPTEYIDEADVVVMESTYGDRLHPQEDAAAIVQAEINAVESANSTLLIPAFALERTQDILHMIMHLKKLGKIKRSTPVFLDSPMAEKATQIYMNHFELFNEHVQQDFEEEGSPFEFPGLHVIIKKSKHNPIHHEEGAKVIIAGSGMMAGGRIVGHAAKYLTNPANRLLIVGYQGEGTLGRELMEGSKEVVIDEVTVPVRATVNVTHAMSSHADQQQLIDWLKHIQGVKKVFLTHGEEESRKVLADKIVNEHGNIDVHLPTMHEEVEF